MQSIVRLIPFLLAINLAAQVPTKIWTEGKFESERNFPDTLELVSFINAEILEAVENGFVYAGLDSVKVNSDTTEVFMHKGNQALSKKKSRSLFKSVKKSLQYYTNNGYPFARLKLIPLQSQDGFEFETHEEKGPLITNDTLVLINPVKTNKSYIYDLIGLKPMEEFNESNYRAISNKFNQSAFLELNANPDVSFQDGRANVYLDISEEASNTFEGVLGIQQNETNNASVVGSFNLSIQNLFKSGKVFDLDWERFGIQSQNLSLKYEHPFFLGSETFPSFGFDLLKQDSSFIRRNTNLGIGVSLSPSKLLTIEYRKSNGDLLSTVIETISQTDLADFNSDLYRIRLGSNENLDLNRLTQGIKWSISLGLGNKEIEKNLSVPDAYYDTLRLKSNVQEYSMSFAAQKLVSKRLAWHTNISGGVLENEELLNNEKYRLGGLSTLRGFDEKFYFASQFFMTRNEIRSYFEESSYLYAFVDNLIFRNEQVRDNPFGIGVGFSLATSSGQFSFALGLGKSSDQDIDFANLKAHFGFISRF